MKKSVRILAVALALLMVTLVFASCGKTLKGTYSAEIVGTGVEMTFEGKNVTITLTGGELREHIMVGDSVMRHLLNETANKTFIGCAGVTANGEFSYNIPMEIGINEAMISRTTDELYIPADHSKLDNTQFHHQYGTCTYERKVTLITDEKANPFVVESLRNMGMEVYQVGLNDVSG